MDQFLTKIPTIEAHGADGGLLYIFSWWSPRYMRKATQGTLAHQNSSQAKDVAASF